MKNWLARLFGSPVQPAPTPPSAVPALTRIVNPPPSFDLDLAFYRSLAGGSAHAGEMPEGLILDALARLARQPEAAAELVPRVPAVIPQLLRSLRIDATSAGELARQVTQDVSLVAEVIREANSPYYRATARIANIEGALMLLGQNGLRMLLARVAFRPLIGSQGGRLARQAAPLVWNQSEKCAMAASMAAPACGADPFEATLAGLMQNVGLVVALRLADQLGGAAPLPQSDDFAHALLDSARGLSAGIAGLWEFPPGVGQAILQAGQLEATPLAQALHEGDRLSKLRVLCDAGSEQAIELATRLSEGELRMFDKLGSDHE
ncbi:HDOD domain-containing protein [Massilia varians]|uniref:HDOD domain-containing protein n=1 Tax=Massilia varians TaxID=457921 RepID=UPI002555256F|nr:HDOD domain-containing protein [Massilia varians]MDK6079799.1 HDOD domain-containing protein [Massilia varians]